ncbi:MAG TPA: HD domain-containing phosphohydrolase [Thermoanaerobaculaceae bacterium]|nr:HD domain-containing phosphohydrolase [Thermoanaerobaculaceae bacterium]
MKLRWQLVLSHLVSILAAAILIGAVHLVLLVRSTQTMEEQNLESSAATVSHALLRKIAELERARDDLAGVVARTDYTAGGTATLARLHELLALYRVERMEVFRGLRRETNVYRWERGTGSWLDTQWLPSNPSIAAKVAGGRAATWVQHAASGQASLKLCAPLPAAPGEEHRWLVVSEPLDGSLLESILPAEMVGALEAGRQVMVAWPEMPATSDPDLRGLAAYLPRAPLAGVFKNVLVRRPALQLDDGSVLNVALMTSAIRSGQSLLVGLRAWLMVVAGGVLLAFVLGSGLASRLLAPLSALLEGTAAMARGHLMVRLPAGREDELGALMREFNRMADEIRNTYLGAISTLAEVVEAKSHYTREHIERVEAIAMATADVLDRRGWVRFSSHQRFILSVAAILHDVGKIAIANEILNKSGPLDSSERQQILTHPEVGALIVERIGKLDRAAEIIRCAHEHFDGTGYPRGLRGEEIPLESRIILAIDALDAMTMDRPYSTGRPQQDAIAELRRQAGRQFDPVVVEAVIEVITSQPSATGAPSSDTGIYRAIHPPSNPGLRPVASTPPAGRG